MSMTLTQVQRLLLGLITSVEAGVTSPADAAEELNRLKKAAKEADLKFEANYTQEDFQRIRDNYAAEYESSTSVYETSTTFETSFESSY